MPLFLIPFPLIIGRYIHIMERDKRWFRKGLKGAKPL